MKEIKPLGLPTQHYYVDEAGDGVIFRTKGQVAIGQNGCSKFFMLGKVHIKDPDPLALELESLRRDLLKDPFLKSIPSIQKENKKTFFMFQAKDDMPEVRHQVFSLLLKHDFKFFAFVRDKYAVLEMIRKANLKGNGYKYKPNDLYKRCMHGLFKTRLHKENQYRITFAKRGAKDKTDEFMKNLLIAREKFLESTKIKSDPGFEVIPSVPQKCTNLQVVDYCLWALQRCFERGEHRFIEGIWEKVGLIIDRDDKTGSGAGKYYSKKDFIPHGFRKKLIKS